MSDNLRVCKRCLDAIQSREGYQLTVPIFVDEDADDITHACDWCGETVDTLYEFI